MGFFSDQRRRWRLSRLLTPAARESVARFARSLCPAPDAADDLVQEALLNAWSRLDALADDGAFRVWLHRVLYTTFLDRADRERRHARKLSALAADESQAPLPFPTPAERLASLEIGERLRAAIEALPHEQRQVVLLVDVEGLTFAEAAHVLDIKQGTVASRVARGRAALRADLWDIAPERGVIG